MCLLTILFMRHSSCLFCASSSDRNQWISRCSSCRWLLNDSISGMFVGFPERVSHRDIVIMRTFILTFGICLCCYPSEAYRQTLIRNLQRFHYADHILIFQLRNAGNFWLKLSTTISVRKHRLLNRLHGHEIYTPGLLDVCREKCYWRDAALICWQECSLYRLYVVYSCFRYRHPRCTLKVSALIQHHDHHQRELADNNTGPCMKNTNEY